MVYLSPLHSKSPTTICFLVLGRQGSLDETDETAQGCVGIGCESNKPMSLVYVDIPFSLLLNTV